MSSLKLIKSKSSKYESFDSIDGSHELKNHCPDAYIDYQVRKREGGKVIFFNFDLAKEMGLIAKNHPNTLNEDLQQKILDTFSLIIINEYDLLHGIDIDPESIKPNRYMATRYLQLQHDDKKGLKSGDGRSIWNGQFEGVDNKIWDISSAGTGGTCLSPATTKFKKFFQSGDPSISYGCGYAETHEGFCTLIMSELYARLGHPTERCLAIIEFENGISINVRANQNLIRPSHIFRYLKQGNYIGLKRIVDYYIDRQFKNKVWKKSSNSRNKYDLFLEEVTRSFAKIAASFENEYIFCWLDWDGDNILMDGGIIDYGSIRQFGLFHHEYRYDDVERFSTSILEQKNKARYIVQSFIQLTEFLKKKEKENIKNFNNHYQLKHFDELFLKYKHEFLLMRIGFPKKLISQFVACEEKLIEKFLKPFQYFERMTTKKGIENVADGINEDAIYCMRDILRELPLHYLKNKKRMEDEQFLKILASSYASPEHYEVTAYNKKMIKEFQDGYVEIVNSLSKRTKKEKSYVLKGIAKRSKIYNKYERITGDGIVKIVDTLMKKQNKISPDKFYKVILEFVNENVYDPDYKRQQKKKLGKKETQIKEGLLKIVRDNSEGL